MSPSAEDGPDVHQIVVAVMYEKYGRDKSYCSLRPTLEECSHGQGKLEFKKSDPQVRVLAG